MDVLHMSRKEVIELPYVEYHEALYYSIMTYYIRSINTIGTDESNKPGTFGVDWSKISSIDETWIKEESERRALMKVLDSRAKIPEFKKR